MQSGMSQVGRPLSTQITAHMCLMVPVIAVSPTLTSSIAVKTVAKLPLCAPQAEVLGME